MKRAFETRKLEPLGLNRTFLLVLVLGLLIAAFRRGGAMFTPERSHESQPGLEKPASFPAGRSNRVERLAAAGLEEVR